MILDEIVRHTRQHLAIQRKNHPLEGIKKRAESLPKGDFSFASALRAPGLSFICEVKRASPSKGIISHDFHPTQIALEYQSAGASAISVLTEPSFFKGSISHFRQVFRAVDLPLLRKDFMIDEYQIYQASCMGASAILCIVALLELPVLRNFLQLARHLGLDVLTECHREAEVELALQAGAELIGVNNRDLKTFAVDLQTSLRLRPLVPKNCIFIAESGIKTPEDTQILIEAGVDAVLVGETLMRSPDKAETLAALKRGVHGQN